MIREDILALLRISRHLPGYASTVKLRNLFPEVWGQVYNRECKLLLLRYAFEVLGLNRVEFHVAHKNIRSQKAVMKIGAVPEGVLRNYAIQPDGSIRHTHVFSITKEEWPGAKEQLIKLIDLT